MTSVETGALIASAILFSVSGAALAEVKQRPKQGALWGIICLLFAPLFLLLALIPKNKTGPEPVSRRSYYVALLAPIAMIAYMAYYVLQINGAFLQGADSPVTAAGLPTCDSPDAIDLAKKALAESPTGKTTGLAIVDMTKAAEVSSTPTERKCTARVLMNNAEDWVATYRLFTRDDPNAYFVEISVAPATGGP